MKKTSPSRSPKNVTGDPGSSQNAGRYFARAKWIWPDDHRWDIHNSYALFRKEFDLAAVPGRAPLFITADQSYQLYINGNYVCRGPARGFQGHWPFDEVDVSKWLKKGRNVIAVRAHNPGFGNFQYLPQGYAGLLVAADWGKTKITTDRTWRCRRQTGVSKATVPTSLQLFRQEHIDLRLEDPGWMLSDFDDSGWNCKVAEVLWNAMPWFSLEERGIPLLREEEIVPKAGLGMQSGKCAEGYRETRDVSRLIHSEGLSHRKSDFDACEFSVAASGRGRYRRVLIDFGRTVVGSLGIRIEGAVGGEIIDTLHCETLATGSLVPDFEPDKHCRMAFSHRLVCRKGKSEHVFYHPFGFRYLVLVVRDSGSELCVRPFLRTALYPMEIAGSFHSSEPGVDEIWQACAWTQQCCSMDAYVDTPWREQAQWWGDARVQAWNTFHLSGDTRLFRRGIAQIASQRTPNGLTYGHAPTMAHNCILPDFSLIWILTLWDYYWQTGSTEPLEAHEETVGSILEFFRRAVCPETGLVRYDPRYWLFLDWTGIQREGCPTVLNVWLVIALDRLAELERVRGNRKAVLELKKWSGELRKALGGLIDSRGLLRDGCDLRGKVSKEASVHSQTLGLLAGLEGLSEKAAMEKVLLPFIRGEKDFKVSPSAYWCTYVFTLLQERGYGADVVNFIRRHWEVMAEYGGTWEQFNPERGNGSFSHAWSAHPLYHFMQILGGICQSAPEWKRIEFRPVFVGESAETEVPTPLGMIRSVWKKNGQQVEVRLELPRGVTARVFLPGVAGREIRSSGSWSILQSASD